MTDPTVRPRRRGALAAPPRRGTTCTGTLAPHGSGSPGNPVVPAPYGTGTARPVVAGDPSSPENAAVHLLNVEQWEIHGLEITFPDTAATRKERNGLLVEIADLPDGVGSHYLVDDVHVHDVDGDSTKWSNGIQFRVSGTTTPTSFDGIVVRAADHALVEHNTAYDIAMRPMGSNAGIWTIDSDATTVQFNDVHGVRRLSDNNDGMAFDSDFGNNGSLFQDNYSHDNEGGFMLFCGACGAGSSSTGTVVRYNLSVGDRSRWLFAVGERNARMDNNTVYLPAGSTTPIVQQGSGSSVTAMNGNLFDNLGTGGYVGFGGSSYRPGDFTWTANVFHGNHPANEPADPQKTTADPLLANPGGTSPQDYRLGAASPARATGAVVPGNGGRDFFGAPVPAVCRPDAGFHQATAFADADCTPGDPVRNGGFETGTLAPWTFYGGAAADPAAAHDGGWAVRVGPAQAAAEQVVTVRPNTAYTLVGWGRVSAAGTELSLGAKQYDTAGSTTRAAFTATAYARGSTDFTTGPTATSVRIYCYARSGSGYGWCDDVTLTAH